MEYQQKLINVYRLTLSDKIALAITCFVLFFVAAPLGAVIRKGGVGMPLVVAIGLFLAYYFSGLLTKNMATNGNINPYCSSLDSYLFPIALRGISYYLCQ